MDLTSENWERIKALFEAALQQPPAKRASFLARLCLEPELRAQVEKLSVMLTRSELARLTLEELTDQHAQQFARKHSKLSPSGINRGLRTLRRALNLAFQWKTLDKPVKVVLATGEHQRDRVLNDTEINKYFAACPQPWKDCATIILEEGFRPSEVFALRWPHVFFNENGTGLVQVVEGKSKAAHRMLPMTPRVYGLLLHRHEWAGRPTEGWIFPSSSGCGHFNGDVAKDQHRKALSDSGVEAFVPYTLRHTALTNLGQKAAGDLFVLAKIAGHSSIAVTQRYIHPQAEAINRVFAQVGTIPGTVEKAPKLKGAQPPGSASSKELNKGENGARGGSRTHMRKNPRRILSPQRLPFRHPGYGQ